MFNNNDLPIPSHLKYYFNISGSDNDEFEVSGDIKCNCGCDEFRVFESNNKHLVKAVCR